MNDRTHEALKELLPAHALGALDPDEARFVEAHLGDYPDCARELAQLRDATAALAFAAPAATPPPGVRAALLERAEALAREAGPSGGEPVAPAPPRATPPARVGVRTLDARRQGGRGARIALGALAAVLVLGLLGWGVAAQLRLAEAERRAERLTARAEELAYVDRLLNDPEAARPVSGPPVSDYGLPAAGYVYTDPAGTIGLMLAYWLPPLGPSQEFQVWLVTPGGERDSGGLFTADARGNAHVVIRAPAPFARYQSVGVTIEPAGGSPRPTSPRVCGGDLR